MKKKGQTTTQAERTKRSLVVLGELLGKKTKDETEKFLNSGSVGAETTRIICETAFTDVWDRPKLDRRSRSLVVIGLLMAQRSHPQLKEHYRIGITNGLSPSELEEAATMSFPYAGVVTCSHALALLDDVLNEPNSKTKRAIKPKKR